MVRCFASAAAASDNLARPWASDNCAAEPSRAMSEAEEVERLKKDLDKCNSIIKVSVRASERAREREE